MESPATRLEKRPSGLALWWRALGFHAGNLGTLLMVLPCLAVPVLCDAVQTILLRQARDTERLQPGAAVRDALRIVPALTGLKLRSEIKAMLWSLLFVFGVPRALRQRIAWSFASNVIVFEGLRGDRAYARCEALADEFYAPGLRALVTIPSLLAVGVFVLLNVGGELTRSAALFWTCAVIFWWIVMPGAAAVNTLLYLACVPRPASEGASPPLGPGSLG